MKLIAINDTFQGVWIWKLDIFAKNHQFPLAVYAWECFGEKYSFLKGYH